MHTERSEEPRKKVGDPCQTVFYKMAEITEVGDVNGVLMSLCSQDFSRGPPIVSTGTQDTGPNYRVLHSAPFASTCDLRNPPQAM